jgi:hypothetical protein
MALPLAAVVWTGTRYVAKKVIKHLAKRAKAKALKKVQGPSKLPKSITKHSKAQRIRAHIADPNKKKFPTAKSIKDSGIKLKDLDNNYSQKGFTRVRTKSPTKKGY